MFCVSGIFYTKVSALWIVTIVHCQGIRRHPVQYCLLFRIRYIFEEYLQQDVCTAYIDKRNCTFSKITIFFVIYLFCVLLRWGCSSAQTWSSLEKPFYNFPHTDQGGQTLSGKFHYFLIPFPKSWKNTPILPRDILYYIRLMKGVEIYIQNIRLFS